MVDQNSTVRKGGPMIHGVYAKDFLLPWEDHEEFSALHDGLKREFFPNGQSEEETVFELAQLYWQKRTLSRLRTASVLADPCTQEIVATGEKIVGGDSSGVAAEGSRRAQGSQGDRR